MINSHYNHSKQKENLMPKYEREVEIDAPVEKVCSVLTNTAYWTKWFPGMGSVSNFRAMNEQCQFDWSTE